MKERTIKFLYALDCYLLYMLSGVISAAGVVAYYSISTAAQYGGMGGGIDASAFIEYISDFVSGKSSLVLLVSYVIVVVAAFVAFKLRGRSLAAYSGMNHARLFSVVGAVVLGAALSIVTYSLVPHTESGDADALGSIALLCIAVGPFVEELMFRGILIKMFGASCGIGASVLITSVLFAVSHGDAFQMLYTFLLGILAAAVRIKSTSLWSAVALHLAFNISGAALAASGFVLTGPELFFAAVTAGVMLPAACSGGRRPISAQ